MGMARVRPFEPPRAAATVARARLSRLEVASGIASGAVMDLLRREQRRPAPDAPGPGAHPGAVAAVHAGAEDYLALKDRLIDGILAVATPEDPERLFPGPDGAAAVTFSHGAAGVLYCLAEVGAAVPVQLTDWLCAAATRHRDLGPGLFDGLGGVALALDRLGRHAEAAEAWRRVDEVPLAGLDVSVRSGLAGLGLALLERTPIEDENGLMARLGAIAGALTARLDGSYGVGILDGGAGAALFLLGLYEVSEDEELLRPVEAALVHDLAALGWGPLAEPDATPLWWHRPVLGDGSAGLAMVLREAGEHVDARWLPEAQEWITLACEVQVPESPGFLDGRAGTALALWYLRRTPWDTPARRRAILRPHLERLGLPTDPGSIPAAFRGHGSWGRSVDLTSGAAGMLLALETLLGPEDRRVPFFW